MNLDAALHQISGNISAVGSLTSEVARRYEGLFSSFRQDLTDVLKQAQTMSEAALATMTLVDAASSSFQNSFPNPAKYDCRDGCAACCHLFVAVPPGMAEAIAEYIAANFSAEQQQALLDRLDNAASTIESKENPLWARVRCPLLGDDGRCTIYPVRPLACRAFTSKSVQRCQTFVFETDPAATTGGVDQNPAHYRLHMEASNALADAAHMRGLPSRQRGLVHSLIQEMRPA